MTQREWHGIDGTAGLGYWTHDPDGSLPLAQLERPIPWASPRRATSIHTYIHVLSSCGASFCVGEIFDFSLSRILWACFKFFCQFFAAPLNLQVFLVGFYSEKNWVLLNHQQAKNWWYWVFFPFCLHTWDYTGRPVYVTSYKLQNKHTVSSKLA